MRRLSVHFLALSALATATLSAQTTTDFAKRFDAIRNRPEYRHARFGAEFYSIEDGKVLFSWNPQELFVPGSTTKILSVGTALELLGPDFRFHTKIYRTGPVVHGTLKGDLVLVASGDPDLSNRIQPDGSMAFQNEDHSYDGFAEAKPVPGDPLAVLRELARQIAKAGIHQVSGRVAVDISLFPEGDKELGTRVVISPVVVNDNLVDVTVTPGAHEGDQATISISPPTRYVKIANKIKTGPAGGQADLEWTDDKTNSDGTHTVCLSGVISAGAPPKLRVYRVPSPSRFAEITLTESLEAEGVHVQKLSGPPADLKTYFRPEYQVAEHVSPPLREEARVTLKVSQNLHASMMPSIVGAYLHKSPDPLQAGFDLERSMLDRAGLDVTGAAQNDGAGGDALFAPDFMVRFLLHLRAQPFFPDFERSLPVLGVDGTLFNILNDSSAAGHVFGKTGTMAGGNGLAPNGGVIDGKGLAGFIETKAGRHLAFAVFINFVPVANMDESATRMVGTAVGEIAAAAYDSLP
jgi:D-alanyl-D-alanine carboxypeptidase/D-alanyl-D-alanine-endopeptidase (penicillin-binding protein 4)